MAKQTPHTQLILPKEKTVAFSGYRESKLSSIVCLHPDPIVNRNTINHTLRQRLNTVIRFLYLEHGSCNFIQGMQSGLDLNAAMSVAEIKDNDYSDIELYGAIPFSDFQPEQPWVYLFGKYIPMCKEVYCMGDTIEGSLHLRRNDFMLLNSSALVCYYDGRQGGTMYTYNRAKKAGLPIYNLCNTDKGKEYGDYHPSDFIEQVDYMPKYILPPNLLKPYLEDKNL